MVQLDPITGEKHIADVLTQDGVAIGLQNSAMSLGEMQARERFYRNMVWIINGSKFSNNFHVLSSLPEPKSELAKEIVVLRYPRHPEGLPLNYALIVRKSDKVGEGVGYSAYHTVTVSPDGVDDRGRATRAEIDKYYAGHHSYEWKWPREVWYEAEAPVLFDFGDDHLWLLEIFSREIGRCVQRIDKAGLIRGHGGVYESDD